MQVRCADIRTQLRAELSAGRFVTDKTGVKTIELIGASFVADEPAIFGRVNEDYVAAEIAWYESRSTNIGDINYGGRGIAPEAWRRSANKWGEINSNYGHLIYSEKYYSQYSSALDELMANPDTRRACMVYNRPSIWREYNENGKNDFICTNAHVYFIRDRKLHVVVQMRSNDALFGYKNDRAWASHVLDELVDDYNFYQDLKIERGDIFWNAASLHVYERHFDLVRADAAV